MEDIGHWLKIWENEGMIMGVKPFTPCSPWSPLSPGDPGGPGGPASHISSPETR